MSQVSDPSESAQASERRIYTISQLLGGLRRLLEDRVGRLWIVGEVSNLHRARSGHNYFSLKDDSGQVRAVLFRASAAHMRFELEEGLEVLVYAEVTVYEARGDLQLIVREVEPRGQGSLQLAIEQLRARLEAEGLFEDSRKLPLPEHPRAIAVITSPTSAAVRDVIHVAELRFPGVPLYVLPTRVQGEGAEHEIAQAIDAISEITGLGPRPLGGDPLVEVSEDELEAEADDATAPSSERSASLPAQADLGFDSSLIPRASGGTGGLNPYKLDVVLLVRGGGSLEDLMCFNSEVVARAIAACPLPVVSGVGHEVDWSIADRVADLRAATPSAAVVAVLPDRRALAAQLGKDWSRLRAAIGSQLRGLQGDWRREHEALRALSPSGKLATQRTRLAAVIRALGRVSRTAHERRRARLTEQMAKLDSLSPLAVLARGYALVRRTRDGEIVRQRGQLKEGELLSIRVAEAHIEAVVQSIQSVGPIDSLSED